jgi:hypothetical protein
MSADPARSSVSDNPTIVELDPPTSDRLRAVAAALARILVARALADAPVTVANDQTAVAADGRESRVS